MTRHRLLRGTVLAGALVLLLLPPGASLAQESSPAAPARVRIVDFSFRPPTVNITAGMGVVWRNDGDNPHTSTSDTGVWDSGVMTPGELYGRRFRRPGTFPYHCAIHPFMTGQVIVSSG